MTDSMQAVYDYIDAHADEYVRDLQTLVRQPSVSAQGIGLRECAELVRDMMHRDGLDAVLRAGRRPTGDHRAHDHAAFAAHHAVLFALRRPAA